MTGSRSPVNSVCFKDLVQSHADELEVFGLISECWDNLLNQKNSAASAIAFCQSAASFDFRICDRACLPYLERLCEILEKRLLCLELKQSSVLVLLQDIGSSLCLV